MREAAPIEVESIKLAHSSAYVDAYCSGNLGEKELKVIGFPWSEEFVHRTKVITGATLTAAKYALAHPGGVAGNLAGGTHHAFADRGEGYCIFNDLAVAAQWALSAGGAKHVAVVDLDVHQGNGTACMLEHVNGASTLSVHADKNYPWKSRHPSDVDVAVPDSVSAHEYLQAVENGLSQLEAHWERANVGIPDLVLFQAGVDPLKHDRLGRLNLTRSDLHERNAVFFRWLASLAGSDLHRRVPVVVTMGGGYSVPIQHSARAHVDVFVQAAALQRERLSRAAGTHGMAVSTELQWLETCRVLDLDKKAADSVDRALTYLDSI